METLRCGEVGVGGGGGGGEAGVLLERGGFPYCFISFPSEKHVFITIGFLCLGNIHACCNQ